MGIPEEESMPALSSPTFEFAMPDDGLIVIARITIMWSHIDRIIDELIMFISKLRTREFDHFHGNKTIGAKLQTLRIFEKREEFVDTPFLVEAINSVEACLQSRNIITHGWWGWKWDEDSNVYHSCAWSRPKDKIFFLKDIYIFHNQVAAALASADKAWYMTVLLQQAPSVTNRRIIYSECHPKDLEGPPPSYAR